MKQKNSKAIIKKTGQRIEMMVNDNKIDKSFYIKLFSIALPMALQNLVTSSLNMIDIFMISSLRTASIAGVSAANKVFFLLYLFLFGISSGSSILTAQYWGIKDVKNIRKVLGVCLVIGVSGAAVFTVSSIVIPTTIMKVFTNEKDAIIEGAKYLRIIGWSYIPSAISFAFVFILRSTGSVKLSMKISILAIALNTFLNWVLIYGNLGAPALGVEGAAIATVIARIVECTLLVGIIYKNKDIAAAKLSELLDWNKVFLKKYMVTVFPVIANELIWAMGVVIYDIVFGRMGENVMAAMGITRTVEQMAFFLVYSVGNASAVILGNQMGTGDMSQVFNYAKRLLRIMVVVGAVMGAVLFMTAKPIAGIFDVDAEVAIYIEQCIKVLSFSTVAKGVNLLIIVGILRSGGDTKFSMYLDGASVWLFAAPLVVIGGLVLKLDIQYVYMLALSEEIVKVVVGLWRTWSKKWINNLIDE